VGKTIFHGMKRPQSWYSRKILELSYTRHWRSNRIITLHPLLVLWTSKTRLFANAPVGELGPGSVVDLRDNVSNSSAPQSGVIATLTELGTIFSTLAGRPSCRTLGTLESPVAWETLPVSLLEPVSWRESGSWCSTEEGTCMQCRRLVMVDHGRCGSVSGSSVPPPAPWPGPGSRRLRGTRPVRIRWQTCFLLWGSVISLVLEWCENELIVQKGFHSRSKEKPLYFIAPSWSTERRTGNRPLLPLTS